MKKVKIIYLCAGHNVLEIENTNHKIIYNDLFIKRDITKDWLDVNLTPYEILIGTPPCNYYSKANYRRDISPYALMTKTILPEMIEKFYNTKKPFIIENVRNRNQLSKIANYCYKKGIKIIELGRHTYFTNEHNFHINNNLEIFAEKENIANKPAYARQGDKQVTFVLEQFIKFIINN